MSTYHPPASIPLGELRAEYPHAALSYLSYAPASLTLVAALVLFLVATSETSSNANARIWAFAWGGLFLLISIGWLATVTRRERAKRSVAVYEHGLQITAAAKSHNVLFADCARIEGSNPKFLAELGWVSFTVITKGRERIQLSSSALDGVSLVTGELLSSGSGLPIALPIKWGPR